MARKPGVASLCVQRERYARADRHWVGWCSKRGACTSWRTHSFSPGCLCLNLLLNSCEDARLWFALASPSFLYPQPQTPSVSFPNVFHCVYVSPTFFLDFMCFTFEFFINTQCFQRLIQNNLPSDFWPWVKFNTDYRIDIDSILGTVLFIMFSLQLALHRSAILFYFTNFKNKIWKKKQRTICLQSQFTAPYLNTAAVNNLTVDPWVIHSSSPLWEAAVFTGGGFIIWNNFDTFFITSRWRYTSNHLAQNEAFLSNFALKVKKKS